MNWPTAELVTSSRTATNIQRVGFTVLCCAMAGGVAQNVDGAEEGTRTPTPLRVHGPEPCASANSATSASVRRELNLARDSGYGDPRHRKGLRIYFTGGVWAVKRPRLSQSA